MIKFYYIFAIFVYFALNTAKSQGLDNVNLLEISSQKNTISINRGEVDNFTEHIKGKFYIQLGDIYAEKFNPKIYLIAEGELVKNYPTKSFWYLNKIIFPNLIHPDSRLFLLTTSEVRAGRHERKIYKRHVVYSSAEYRDPDEYLEKNSSGIPQKMLIEQDKFENSGELSKTDLNENADIKIESYEKFKKNKDNSVYSFKGEPNVVLVDILDKDDKKLLDSISKEFIEKPHKISSNKNDMPRISSVYDDVNLNKKERAVIDPRFSAKVKRDGIQWSDDMDDLTLRRYFITTGIVQERARRERVLNESDGNEIIFHYSGSLSDHSNPNDQANKSLGYDLGVSYDFHLSRANYNLKSWSLQFLLDWGVGHYNLGQINGNCQEVVYGAILNYYLLNNPLSLNEFIFEIGAGFKLGQAQISGSGLQQQYTYQIMSFPTLQLISKYRLSTNYAINIGAIIDNKKLNMVNTPVDAINRTISVNDIKLQIGMGFYF